MKRIVNKENRALSKQAIKKLSNFLVKTKRGSRVEVRAYFKKWSKIFSTAKKPLFDSKSFIQRCE